MLLKNIIKVVSLGVQYKMALTQIENGMITDSILTASKLNTTGTASATTVLKGDFSWGTGASASGKWSIVDSAPGSPVAGDMWYTGGVIYIAADNVNTTGVWSTSNSLPMALQYLSGCGTQTAGLSMAGFGGSPLAYGVNTFEYNGTTWSVGGNLNTARGVAGGFGLQTAAAVCGGWTGSADLNSTEEYDGTSWSAGGNLNNARRELGATGIQSAGLCMGGFDSVLTEEYNGSSWTNGGNLATDRYTTAVEEYNGTSWTGGGAMAVARHYLGGCGTQTAALSFAGYEGITPADNSSVTEEYDGTAWSGAGSVSLARTQLSGFGSQGAALAMGGYTYIQVATCEERNPAGQFNAKNVGYS